MSNEKGKQPLPIIVRDSRAEKRTMEETLKDIKPAEMPAIGSDVDNLAKEKWDEQVKSQQQLEMNAIINKCENLFIDSECSEKVDKLRQKYKSLSFISDEEEEDAKKFIEEQLGFERPRVAGYHMAVKIYVRPSEMKEFTKSDGTKGRLYLPDIATVHDKFRNCTALVLSQGPDCYSGPRFQEHWFIRLCRIFFNKWMKPSAKQPWCKVGDWIVIPRNEGTQVNYRGIPMQYIADDRCLGIVEDPSHVTRD